MPAGILNINLNQYATFQMGMVLTDPSGSAINLTNWSLTGSLKENYAQTGSTVNFTCTVTTPASGAISISLPYTEARKLVKKKYVYDIIATNIAPNPPEVYRILEGQAFVDLGVTTD
jgi:hypothetical protein